MTIRFDVVLPQVNVLGSTIAYWEAGDREAPTTLFLHGNPTRRIYGGISLRSLRPWRIASHRILIGFGQSNLAHRKGKAMSLAGGSRPMSEFVRN